MFADCIFISGWATSGLSSLIGLVFLSLFYRIFSLCLSAVVYEGSREQHNFFFLARLIDASEASSEKINVIGRFFNLLREKEGLPGKPNAICFKNRNVLHLDSCLHSLA